MPKRPPTYSGLIAATAARDRQRARRLDSEQQAIDRIRSSARWQRLRRWYLANHPMCQDCKDQGRSRPATQVDHVLGLKTHPFLAFEPRNLRALCVPCHAAKSARERSR